MQDRVANTYRALYDWQMYNDEVNGINTLNLICYSKESGQLYDISLADIRDRDILRKDTLIYSTPPVNFSNMNGIHRCHECSVI